MDYRILCLFLAPFPQQNNIALRMFDVLHSGIGDTTLHINVVGDVNAGLGYGYIDVLATDGRRRRLQPISDTSPSVWTHWLGALADFVTVYPIREVIATFDTEKGNADPTHWSTRRQCRRKETADQVACVL